MIKRNKKVISTIIATCAVVSLMPTMGVSASVRTLQEKDGDINNAIAYKDGKYILDGQVSYNESEDEFKDDGVFYFNNNDSKKTLKESDSSDDDDKDNDEISSNADATIFGDKYIELQNGDYYFNLETGKITDDSIKNDNKDDASTALKKKLKKTDRYNKNENEPSLTLINAKDFSEQWYEYNEEGFNGYTDSSGKYIDADYNMGSINVVIDGSKKKFKNTKDSETINGKKYKLFVSDAKTLGQDSKNIYRKAKIEIKEYDSTTNTWVTPTVRVIMNAKDDDTKVVVTDKKVTGITINGDSAINTKGGTLTLKSITSPSDASDNAVTWSSSNESVATIDNTGLVTAKTNGTVTITATAKDGSGIKTTKDLTITGQADVTTTTGSSVTVTTDAKLTVATEAVVKAETSKLQADVDSAQTLVSALTDSTDKTNLQSRLDTVKNSLKSATTVETKVTTEKIDTDKTTVITANVSSNIYASAISSDSKSSQTSMVVIQKMSKEQDSDDIEDAKYPKTVTSYELIDSDDKDNVIDLYSTDDISFVDGKIISWTTNDKEVKVQVLTEKTKNGITYFEENTSDDEDYEALDTDVDGNLWRLDSGKIYKFDNDEDWNQSYKCDGGMNNLSVYDKDNLVVWSSKDEIYSVVSGSASDKDETKATDADATTAVVKAEISKLQADVDSAKALVKTLDEGTVKTDLTNRLDTVQKAITAPTQQTGWIKNNNGTWSFINTDGSKATGWIQDKGTWYFLDSSNIMQTGWLKDKGTWYYLDGSGAMKTGWFNDYGTWYYLNTNGSMATGWLNDNGTWYFLNDNGSMAHDTYISGYYLGSNGAWV